MSNDAHREYLLRHLHHEVTEAVNRVCSEIGNLEDPPVTVADRFILERVQWQELNADY